MSRWFKLTWLFAAALALGGFLFVWRYLSPPPELVIENVPRTLDKVPAELDRTDLHIISFYSGRPVIAKGEKAVLCYGVLNAVKVTLTPPVEPLSPSINRCFEVAPTRRTSYRLTASSAGGETREAEFTIQVK